MSVHPLAGAHPEPDHVTARLIELLADADDVVIVDTPDGAVLHEDTVLALAWYIAEDRELAALIAERDTGSAA